MKGFYYNDYEIKITGNGLFRFTSKEWDEETGLYSFPARYYEPKLSLWMSVDPAGPQLVNPMEQDSEGSGSLRGIILLLRGLIGIVM